MAIEHLSRRGAEVAHRIRRIRLPFTGGEAGHLALVLLRETHLVVLGVALEEHEAKAVGAYRQVNPGFLALAQHLYTSRLDIRAGHLVDVRVGAVETGVQVRDQRMIGEVAVLVDAPALVGKAAPARDAVELLKIGVRRQT